MLEAVNNARRGTANIVLLTSLGGGAFDNAPEWIHAAIKRAVKKPSETWSKRSPFSAIQSAQAAYLSK